MPQERRRLRAILAFLLQSAPDLPAINRKTTGCLVNVIELLYASNLISRRRRTPEQHLAFAMLVENRAYDKRIEVRWRGETGRSRAVLYIRARRSLCRS